MEGAKYLGLLSKPDEDLNGLAPDEFNQHITGVSVSQQDSDGRCKDVFNTASLDGFKFKEVGLADVLLAVSHFSSQARGEDGISQSVVAQPIIRESMGSPYNWGTSCGVVQLLLRARCFPGSLEESMRKTYE